MKNFKLFNVVILIFVLSLAVFGQSFLRNRCLNSKASSSLTLTSNGYIFPVPCPNKSFQLLDVNYRSANSPYQSVFTIGNNDNIDINTGGIPVSTNYFTTLTDIELDSIVGGKFITNEYSSLRVKGNAQSSLITGKYIYTDNRWETSGATNLYGVFTNTNIESHANFGVGGHFGAILGNLNATPKIIGVEAVAGGHGGGGEYVSGDFLISLTNDGATSPLLKGVKIRVSNPTANTSNDVRGLSLESWNNVGIVTNSYGIYADSSIDVGVNKYFIYSTSTSPSLFTGNITTMAKLFITLPQTPVSSVDTCSQGQIFWDSNFIYVCVSANTIKRSALASF